MYENHSHVHSLKLPIDAQQDVLDKVLSRITGAKLPLIWQVTSGPELMPKRSRQMFMIAFYYKQDDSITCDGFVASQLKMILDGLFNLYI